VTDAPLEPDSERELVTHQATMTATLRVGGSASAQVERGLNDTRLAVLGILVAIGLTVGFGAPGGWAVQLVAGAGSFALACALIRWPRSRHVLMEFMHRLTGQ
jgi:uncharacterized membrane protein YedE/YeeE